MKYKKKGKLNAVRLLALLVLVVGSFGSNAQGLWTDQSNLGAPSNPNNDFTFKAQATCGGQVTFTFWSQRKLKNLQLFYDGVYQGYLNQVETVLDVNGQPPANNWNGVYNKNTYYSWTETFPSVDTYSEVTLLLEYAKINDNWCGSCVQSIMLGYAHLGDNPEISIGYSSTWVAPNTYEFKYSGDDLLAGTGVDSYTYIFDNDTDDPSNTTITTGSLTPGNLIGPPSTAENPKFYCRGGNSVNAATSLVVNINYLLNSQTLTCPQNINSGVVLVDLCDYFTGFNVQNVSPNPLSSIVQTSTCSDPTIEAMSSITLDNGVSGPATAAFNTSYPYTYSTTGSYDIVESIVIEPGTGGKPDCGCTNIFDYNTDNPCYDLSTMTASYEFADGAYVYTYVPSEYLGSNVNYTIASIIIDFGDGTPPVTYTYPLTEPITHVYEDGGEYTVTQIITYNNWEGPPCISNFNFTADEYCCTNFAPDPNQRYWISGWVREEHATQKLTYPNAYIELAFTGGVPVTVQFHTSGDIVEGWQRIVGDFRVPTDATEMEIHLVNDNTGINTYFDDVRVHPFNASMKSYVYDPETLWLTAELDDNNYATFYEYDLEGQLIRIKKETARGIMTIQESRSSNPKAE